MKPRGLSTEEKILGEKVELNYSKFSTPPATPRISIQDTIIAKEKTANPSTKGMFTSSKVYLGFVLEPRTQERIKQVEEALNRKFEIIMVYVQWGNSGNSTIDKNLLGFITDENKTPLVTWEPWNPDLGINQNQYKLSNIIRGDFDSYIKQTAVNIKNTGKPLFLRFAHEMNSSWYPWGGTVNGNSAADYIAAWKHVWSLFKEQEVTNVTWVWSPNSWSVPYLNGNQITDFYPGADYVDWIGLDGYNFGSSKAGSKWDSFDALFTTAYKSVIGFNKPIMIAETASSEVGGDKSSWISDAFNVQIPQNFPGVKALIWFNINKETNWEISSSSNSLDSFRSAVNRPFYSATLVLSGSKINAPNNQ